MPYKTKDGRLVNEVTLGDGYPLSNNLQPIKVAGEASAIEVSKALPDESNNAKVKITGDLEVTGTTKGISASVSDATTTTKGIVELADTGEAISASDATKAVTPDGLGAFEGTSNIITVGAIETGEWQGTAIESVYLDADTAHLSGAQTFTGAKTFDDNIFIKESASADADVAGDGQLWVKNDTPNNLYFTNDAGNDVQITNGSSLAGGSGGATDHYMDWHYNFANLSSTNTFYANTHIDDFGVSSSINTGITDYNDTEASDIWRIIRHGKRIPYSGTITKVITHVESTGASADSDIEVGVWIASISGLSLDTQLATTTNVAIDNLAKIDFDFDTATRIMLKETTSFNATSLTASDFMFITLRRTSGTDGSSFNCHTTVLYEGS